MVVLDASFLLLLLEPGANGPLNKTTGKLVDHCKERIEQLVVDLGKSKSTICIPAPSLAEFLVRAGTARAAYLETFKESAAFKVEPFGERAAIECAFLMDADLKARHKLSATETKAKVKFDRQIIAIAKAVGAHTIYTEDEQLGKVAKANGLAVSGVADLPLPAETAQGRLALIDPD